MRQKSYTSQFRKQLVELNKSDGSAASLSAEFGPTPQPALNCVHRVDRDLDGESIKNSPECVRLLRELARVQEERDILANVTASFAQDGKTSRLRDAFLNTRIRAIHDASTRIYGVPRVHTDRRSEAHAMDRKLMARLMRGLGKGM